MINEFTREYLIPIEDAAQTGEPVKRQSTIFDTDFTDADDRTDPSREAPKIPADMWVEMGYYAVNITVSDEAEKDPQKETVTAFSFDEYERTRNEYHEHGYFIVAEDPKSESQYFPGLMTFERMASAMNKSDEKYITLRNFPMFSAALKMRVHDSIVLAAETKGGKSSLALNFLDDLNDRHPVLYFNLENDALTVYQRMISIRTGMNLDDIEKYKTTEATRDKVAQAIRDITSRKPFHISESNRLDRIEAEIQRVTQATPDPVIVCIDHGLLTRLEHEPRDRYSRFSDTSEALRRMAKKYNIVMLLLLQQNRAGKADNAKPTVSSLKESGSWENDASKICFLWQEMDEYGEPKNKSEKLLIMAANRNGPTGEYVLTYNARTQQYAEKKPTADYVDINNGIVLDPVKMTQRDKIKEEFDKLYDIALEKAKRDRGPDAHPTKREIMNACGKRGKFNASGTTANSIEWHVREYGGYTVYYAYTHENGNPKPTAEDEIHRDAERLTKPEEARAGIADIFPDEAPKE